jgi:cytochrome c-type biogenesis protein CcmH/NrfG
VTQARERFRAALAQRPDGCEALVGLGDVELEGGNLSTAVSQYRRALSLCPRAGDAWVGLGQAYTSMQNYDQAITAYTRYLDVNPGGGHANMARRHIEQLRERIAASGASPTTPTPGH